jgi:hypothetical protein
MMIVKDTSVDLLQTSLTPTRKGWEQRPVLLHSLVEFTLRRGRAYMAFRTCLFNSRCREQHTRVVREIPIPFYLFFHGRKV